MAMAGFSRMLRHLFFPGWLMMGRAFPRQARVRIAAAVAASERGHAGEIRFVVEGALDFLPLVRGETARQRALAAFSSQGVWDTQANNGVLIYLLLADREVEILADRGFNGRVEAREWAIICREMEAYFARGEFEQGALAGIARIDVLSRRYFPVTGPNPDELPNAPSLL